MKINNPLAIILRKVDNGYVFQSLEQVVKDQSKKSKLGRKPTTNRSTTNRLIKQIGLSNEQLISSVIPPESLPLEQIQEKPQQNVVFEEPNEEQEIYFQIDRDMDPPESPAIWFDKEKIHDIQKSEMNEFFINNSSKTPQLYQKYRNFIVDAYNKNPKRYLTKISCRRILRGDINLIMRIHTFLQRHGIINFGIDYQGNYTFKSTQTFNKNIEQRLKPQSCLKSVPEEDEQTKQRQIDTDNLTITVINKNFSRTYRACCSKCKLVCGIVWYANISDDELTQKNLCFQCFSSEQIPQQQKIQYEKVDILKKMQAHSREGKNYPKVTWNIQENIRLLDFMSNSKGESWRQLLDSFGGKRNIEDIVLQFLQFPISNIAVKETKAKLEEQLRKQREQEQLGFSSQDYLNILSDFYTNSVYSSKQMVQQKHQEDYLNYSVNNIQNQVKNEEDKSNSSISQIISLLTTKILLKIEQLRDQQGYINLQMSRFGQHMDRKPRHQACIEQPAVEPQKSNKTNNQARPPSESEDNLDNLEQEE